MRCRSSEDAFSPSLSLSPSPLFLFFSFGQPMELVKNVKNGHNNYTGRVDGQGSNNKQTTTRLTRTRTMMVGLLPYTIWIACSLSSTLMARVFTVTAVVVCQWLHHVRLWPRCRWLGFLHLAREAPRLCPVETVLPSPEGVLLLREAHAAAPRSNR